MFDDGGGAFSQEITNEALENSIPTKEEINQSKNSLRNSLENMRSKIKAAKIENNKEIGNYKLELIQLTEQGDQVVKSPWSSWQFTIGYILNNQKSAYTGKGNKAEKYPFEGIFARETGEREMLRYVSPNSPRSQFLKSIYGNLGDVASRGNSQYGLANTKPEYDYPVPIEFVASINPRTPESPLSPRKPRTVSKNPAVVVAPQVTTPSIPSVKNFSTPSPIIGTVDIAQIQVDKITNLRGGTANEAFILNSQKPNNPDYTNQVIISSEYRKAAGYRDIAAMTQTSAIGGTINVHSKGDTYDMWTEGVTFKGVVDKTHLGGSKHELAYTYTGNISREQGKDYGKNWGTTRYPRRYAAYAAMRTTSGQRMDIKDVTINYRGQEFVEDEPDPRFPQQYHFRRFLFYADLSYAYADTTINISEKTKINIDGNRLVMVGLVHAINRIGYNVGVYNQGRITTSARGKNNYIMSSVVFDQGPHPERLFFVNGEKGKITLNGEKDTFASLQTVGSNQGASTIVNKGDIIFNGKGARGIISGINRDQSQTYFYDKNLEILLYKPMIFNGDNSVGMAFYYNRGNPSFEGGVDVFDQNDTSVGYDGTPNRVVQFPNKTLPSILRLRMNGKNSVGMLFEPIYGASDTGAEEVNPGGTSPNAPAGHKGLVDIVSTGDNSQLIYIKRGHINIKNPDSKLIADNTKKNTALYVNGEYYDRDVTRGSYVYDRNVSLVTNEAKISMKNSEDSVGIYARGILKDFVSGKVKVIRDYVNNSRAKVTNTGEITITGKAVKGIISDNANVTNTGKLIFDGSQKNDTEGSVGLAALDGGYLKSTGAGSEIKVSGKSSIGLYVTRDKSFNNIGVANTVLSVENTKIEADNGAANVYANGGTVNLGTTGSSTATVNMITGKDSLTFNNTFFYKDNKGNTKFDINKNGKINLLGKVKAEIKEGGTVFYLRGNGGTPLFSTLNNDVFNGTLGNLTLNMNAKSTLVSASNVTANLSSVSGGTINLGGSQPTFEGSRMFKLMKLHLSKFNVDANVNLDSATDAFNRIDLVNTSVDIKNGYKVVGTKDNQNVIAQENPDSNVGSINLVNNGTINLSGKGSSAIYGKFSTITNNGTIKLGENSTALYGKADSLMKNTGTITLGKNSIAMFATEGKDNEVTNTGTINGNGEKAVGMVFDGKGAGARRINNASTIDLSGNSTIGIYAKGSNYSVENNGTIKVGNGTSLNNLSVGMLATENTIKLKNNGTISTGNNGIGIYGFDNIENKGSITTGNNGIAIYSKNNITSTGKIVTGNDSFGIYGIDNITNKNNITTGNNGVAIYGRNTITSIGNLTAGNDGIGIYGGNTITSTGNISTRNNGIGIYAKNNIISVGNISAGVNSFGLYGENTITSTGNITVGNDGVGIYGKNTITSNGNITAGDKGIGIYGENTITSNGSITTGDNSIGVYAKGQGVTVGNITVGKNNSTGIYLANGGGNVNSNGNMTIGENSYGVISNKGTNNFNFTSSNTSNVTIRNKGIYLYSTSTNGTVTNNANITGIGNEIYGLYTAGRNVVNNGNMNLGSGIGNIGMYSIKGGTSRNSPSGRITVGSSYVQPDNVDDRRYAIGMAAGFRNQDRGSIINEGIINVRGNDSIGMYATGRGSTAINKGTINLGGKNTVGMLLDNGARGKNEGIIRTMPGANPNDVEQTVGVFVGKDSVLENTGTIHIVSKKGAAYFQSRGGIVINRGTIILGQSGRAENGEEESGAPGANTSKTVGDTRIHAPKGTQKAKTYINGKEVTPAKMTVTEGERPNMLRSPIGMYIDTLRRTNPIVGLKTITNSADLIIGIEAATKTNSKAIEVSGELLKPYNKTIEENLANGGVKNWNIYSGSLTWTASATLSGGTISKLYMVKRPYTSFASDKNTTRDTYNFADGLEQRYGVEALDSREKSLFNKLNSIGNREQIILYQAFDEMMGHQYANIHQRVHNTGNILDKEFSNLRKDIATASKNSNKLKTFGTRGEYKTNTAGVINTVNNAYGLAFIHENEDIRLGKSVGYYAGFVHNTYKFKDIGRSKEEMLEGKVGVFKSIPFDENNSLNWTISGDVFYGYNKMHRKFLVVNEIFNAKGRYSTYGVAMKNELGKEFRLTESISLRPYGAVKLEYGKIGKVREKFGEIRLDVKDSYYTSIKPEVGVEANYKHTLKSGKIITARVGTAYENELGKVASRNNKARVAYTNADWFNLPKEKEDRKGNLKTDFIVGVEGEILGGTANIGYDTKGNNLRGGLGLRIIF
ncbi:autotransporter-associated N-terminal domain-containing protein [Fusobacterium nucleatum]